MIRKAIFGFATALLFVSCTDTAAIYREAMELKKLEPNYTGSERDDISGKSGLFDITYTFYKDKDGDPRRALIKYEQGDTTWIDDRFYKNDKPLYCTSTILLKSDTISSCTYFFHHGKCIKRACAFGEPQEEKTAEMAMEFTFITMKGFTR